MPEQNEDKRVVQGEQNVCITCADAALEAQVLEILPDHYARVQADGSIEVVSVALVDASDGDWLLVHAGEAIAKLEHR